MRTTGILFFVILTLNNIFGVSMGYTGIARLKAHHIAPFPMPDTAFYMISYGAPCPPYRITLTWDSTHFLIWLGCLLVPSIAGAMILNRQYVFGWTAILAWAVLSGLYGFWLWFFSIFSC